jgi:hypothetical protein
MFESSAWAPKFERPYVDNSSLPLADSERKEPLVHFKHFLNLTCKHDSAHVRKEFPKNQLNLASFRFAFLLICIARMAVVRAEAQTQVFPQWTARFHVQNSLKGPADSTLNSIAADSQGNTYVAHTVCLLSGTGVAPEAAGRMK